MIKLKDLINERLTLRDFDSEIEVLRKEWDRLDAMGGQETRQYYITKKIEKLLKEKERWETLYKAVELAPNPIKETKIPIYRGISVYNKSGNNYYTTDKEWARQFTQSGQDKEIKTITIDTNVIYKANPLPAATNENEINNTIKIAKQKGYKAIWVDEGVNEPNSIFIFNGNP